MADRLFTVKVDFSDAAKVLENHGLEKGGRVQAFFTSEVMRRSDPYVPFSSGPLKNTAEMTADKDGIVYNQPYSRFHWYGKVMIYEPTGSTWAPKYGQKVVTDRVMKYQGAPLRGPHWVTRCWLDNKYDIIRSTEEFARKIK
ncbi:MAG: hypothetical protein J6L62_02765 [Clostridia bacterium]|nr:hypothetical protein [Clostridia bacterium]